MVLIRALAFAALVVAGCIEAPPFQCARDADCGEGLRCEETTHHCSITIDDVQDCESGRLYDVTAGADAGECVECVPDTTAIASVVAGSGHTCVITVSNTLYCWGNNTKSQLGRPGAALIPNRVAAPGVNANIWTMVAAGEDHTCAHAAGGDVYCWGNDANGVTGKADAETVTSHPTQPIATTEDIARMEAGHHNTCMLSEGRGLLCWGKNNAGQLGQGQANFPNITTPMEVQTPGNVELFALGLDRTCYVSSGLTCLPDEPLAPDEAGDLSINFGSGCVALGGDVSCWGNLIPPEPKTGAMVSAGEAHACAASGATVTCWGTIALPPTTLATNINKITSGARHTCVLLQRQDDIPTVYCWGANDHGQLGLGTSDANIHTPTPIGPLCR